MVMKDKLERISEQMINQINNDDGEMAHSKADDLLVELIDLLSRRSKHKEIIQEIIEDYNKVLKWWIKRVTEEKL